MPTLSWPHTKHQVAKPISNYGILYTVTTIAQLQSARRVHVDGRDVTTAQAPEIWGLATCFVVAGHVLPMPVMRPQCSRTKF